MFLYEIVLADLFWQFRFIHHFFLDQPIDSFLLKGLVLLGVDGRQFAQFPNRPLFDGIYHSSFADGMGVVFVEEDSRGESLGEEGLTGGVVGDYEDAAGVDIVEDVFQTLLEHGFR